MLIDARNYRSRILIFEANARSIRSRDDNSDDEFFEKYEDIINAGNNQTQREPRTIKQRRGTRGSGCCTLDLFKVLCKRNCREPLAIFSRDYVSNRIGSEVFGRKVKKNAIVSLSIIVENDFVPHFIHIELFMYTYRPSRGIEMRVVGELHVTRDRKVHRVYMYVYIYIYTKVERKISTLENFNFPISDNPTSTLLPVLKHALFLDTKRKNALDTYETR